MSEPWAGEELSAPGRDGRTGVCDTPHWGLLSQGARRALGPIPGGLLHQARVTESCSIHEPGTRKTRPPAWGSGKESCHPSKVKRESLAKRTNKPNNRLGVWMCGPSKLKHSHDNRSGTAETPRPPQTLTLQCPAGAAHTQGTWGTVENAH